MVNGSTIAPESLKAFNHFAIEDNVAIGYAVADQIGLSRHRALAAMRTGDQPVHESENKRNTIAYCRPQHRPTKP